MSSLLSVRTTCALGILAFFVAGCGEQRRAENAPNPDLRNANSLYQGTAAPSKPSAQRRLQGPRPAAEIDGLYSASATPMAFPLPVASRANQPYGYLAPVDDGRVTADPAWDVNITREWRHIVLHHSASATGCAASFDKSHREERGWDGLGYHFVVGNGTGSGDGEVEVGYRWTRQMVGAHAGNAEYNQHGIGICLVGDFEKGSLPSPRQMSSLRRLVRFLQVKTGVPTAEIIAHCNVPGKNTLCPGNLDLNAFRASLGNGAIGVPILFARQSRIGPSVPLTVARGSAAVP